jgi:hypothetical protein
MEVQGGGEWFSPYPAHVTGVYGGAEHTPHDAPVLPYHAPHANMVTMAPSPLVRNMSKHDEDMGYRQKNISVQLGLVRVDLTQRTIKKHMYSLKKHTFCQHALWSAAHGTSSYTIKNELLSIKKNASPCCGDCASPCDIGRLHSPIILKPLEADGRGDHGVVFLCVLLVLFVVLCTNFFSCVLLVLFVVSCSTMTVGYFFE